MIVVIDGPAGTGKTTVAKKVAQKLGFEYFDTGALYRCVAYLLLKEGVDVEAATAVESHLRHFSFSREADRYLVNGEDVTDEIRSLAVTAFVSKVAALGVVREALIDIQRDFGKEHDAVLEGRDLGTRVFPDADHKIFLTASPEVRARRRFLELKGKSPVSEEEVLQQILERDQRDSTRQLAPLKKAEDAYLVDTSTLSIDEVVEAIITEVQP